MASLEKRNQVYRIVFMFSGKRHSFSLGTNDLREAEILRGGIEKTLMRIDQNLLKLPPGIDVVAFVKNDGRIEEPPPLPQEEPTTFAQFRDRYLTAHESGSIEANSLHTIRIHLNHLSGTLGDRFPIGKLQPSNLQDHITRRSAMKGLGGQAFKSNNNP